MVRLPRLGARSLWVFLLWLAGCQSMPNPWQALPPPSIVLTEAQPVWERLTTRRQQFENLKGLARVQLQAGTRRADLEDMAIVLRHFEALRLEGLGPVMQPLFLLLADAQHLTLYAPQDGRLLSGAPSAENLLRLFGLAMAPQALQYVLVGDVPWPTLPTGGHFVYERRENLYRWQGTLHEPGRHGRVWFEPYDWRPVRFVIEEPPGHLILQGWYEDFIQVRDFSLPGRITLSQPDAGRKVIWQYRDVQVNPGVTPALFRLRVPPGTERLMIEDLPTPEADTLPRLW
ncbi:MAG: hypothetical protein AB7N91_18460 [Candidatus Tectimicrobiota bacterium]